MSAIYFLNLFCFEKRIRKRDLALQINMPMVRILSVQKRALLAQLALSDVTDKFCERIGSISMAVASTIIAISLLIARHVGQFVSRILRICFRIIGLSGPCIHREHTYVGDRLLPERLPSLLPHTDRLSNCICGIG